jgi:hypothetical protein
LATLPSPSLLCSLLLAPLNVIARDFLILFHVCIWSPSTILPIFSSSSPLPIPFHTHYTYFTVLSFIFDSKINVQWGFSMYPSY